MKIRLFRPEEHVTTNNFEEIEIDGLRHNQQPIMKAGVLYTYWYYHTVWKGANYYYVHYYRSHKEILDLDK